MQFLASNMRQMGFLARGVYAPATGPFGGHATLATNIVSYWKLDETSGTSLAAEAGSNTGTLYNGTVNQTGIIGKCIQLDGTGDYISFGNDASLSANDMSYSFWAKSSSSSNPSSNEGLIFKAADTGQTTREIGCVFRTSGLINAKASDSSAINYDIDTATDFYDAAWHHVVITKERGVTTDTLKMYVDGSLIGTDNTASGHIVQTSADLEFGRLSMDSNADRYFTGYVDEIGVWDKVLTSTEVTALYNSGSGLTY